MNVLTIYTMKNCPACEEAKPEFEQFKREMYGKLICLQADVTAVTLSTTGINVKATPTYELMDEKRKPLKRIEGALDVKHLHEFVFGALGKKVRT